LHQRERPNQQQGGGQPEWRSDGRELFYRVDGKLLAVPVKSDPNLEIGVPKVLFEIPKVVGRSVYAVASDGQRFLVIAPAGESIPASITVVVDWIAGLKQ